MPPRGKCQSCGEVAYLTAKVLVNPETWEMQCVMICSRCADYYEQKRTENDEQQRID